MSSQPGMLIYEDPAAADGWFRFLIGGILALTFVLGIVFLTIDKVAAAVMFAVTIFDGLLFYFIFPRKYQIYSDRLVVVLGGPFTKTIKLWGIKSVSHVAGSNAFASGGLRFANSTEYVVQIVRSDGLPLVVAPASHEYFIAQLNQAIELAKKG